MFVWYIEKLIKFAFKMILKSQLLFVPRQTGVFFIFRVVVSFLDEICMWSAFFISAVGCALLENTSIYEL